MQNNGRNLQNIAQTDMFSHVLKFKSLNLLFFGCWRTEYFVLHTVGVQVVCCISFGTIRYAPSTSLKPAAAASIVPAKSATQYT